MDTTKARANRKVVWVLIENLWHIGLEHDEGTLGLKDKWLAEARKFFRYDLDECSTDDFDKIVEALTGGAALAKVGPEGYANIVQYVLNEKTRTQGPSTKSATNT
ncbi:MAG TPA: hypothetical protein VGP13_00465 [Candidatus Paceibacterota bacterium]|jgi:hypothetical protein|nr:hypothetical protein [Candidatus Paceibacterota bacterium]